MGSSVTSSDLGFKMPVGICRGARIDMRKWQAASKLSF